MLTALAGDDPEFKEAIVENLEVIPRQEAKISALKQLIVELGGEHVTATPAPAAAPAPTPSNTPAQSEDGVYL